MPFPDELKTAIYDYCNNHLPDEAWYDGEFEFIEKESLRKRLTEEFKAIRFAYKFYEGIEATDENLIFEIRYQLFAYASIYEAIIHYILFEYYSDTPEFHDMRYHMIPKMISIPTNQRAQLTQLFSHDGKTIIPYHMKESKKDENSIRFDEKCRTAEKLGLIHKFKNPDGIEIDMPSEIIEIYSCRNAIHLLAEMRKALTYELELSRKAYRRMSPFITQIKDKLKADKKGVYAK